MHRNRVNGMNRLRFQIQILYTILTNGYVYGFLSGKIYRGKLKYACVPGLNCYSCPGAIAARSEEHTSELQSQR